jgi:hypothetical protein
MPAGGDPGQPAAQPGGDATETQPAPADAAPPADPGAVAPADPTTTPAAAPTTTPPAVPTASASVHAKPADTTTTPAGTPATPAGSEAVKPTGGGGRVGMLLLSNYVLPKTVNTTGYFNHFSLLRSIEDLFAVDHLGYAATPTLGAFDKSVYSAYNTDG